MHVGRDRADVMSELRGRSEYKWLPASTPVDRNADPSGFTTSSHFFIMNYQHMIKLIMLDFSP